MPNAVWTGTLSFGLVSVPVRLFPATEPKDVRFHQYDRSGRRLRYRRVVEEDASTPVGAPPGDGWAGDGDGAPPEAAAADAEATGDRPAVAADRARAGGSLGPSTVEREVAWGDMLLGRETETGGTVLVERDEVERLRPRRSATIDIEDFVELRDIDPVYFEKTYHAVPRSADDAKPYALLHHALRRSGRVGIGRFVLRTKPHLVAVRAMEDVLAVETLYFGDEVRDASRVSPVDLEGVRVNDRELALAQQLIDTLATEWDPDAYADTYREELLELLASKEPVTTVEPSAEARPVGAGGRIDALMDALRESVEAAKRDRGAGTRAERTG